jgi:hypothetical protein
MRPIVRDITPFIPVLVLSFFGAAYVVCNQLQESAEQQKTERNRVEQVQIGVSLRELTRKKFTPRAATPYWTHGRNCRRRRR